MKANWHILAVNPQAIAHLYDEVPDLDPAWLYEVTWHRELNHLSLRIKLNRFPDYPPERWSKDIDRVQVTLDCAPIKFIKIYEVETAIDVARIQMERLEEEKISIKIDSDSCKLDAICLFFRISHISGY